MKTVMMLLALTALSFNAHADRGNDGPSAVPNQPIARVVAEVSQACGFMCRDGDYRGVRVRYDGKVEAFEGKRNTPEKIRNVAFINVDAMSKLISRVEKLEISELVDTQKDAPECLDAPSTVYSVYKSNAQRSTIAMYAGCHDHVMSNGMGKDITGILKGFESLAQ